MTKLSRRQFGMAGLALAGVSLAGALPALAQQLKGGKLRVAVLSELANYDPQQLSTVNFHVIKNLYDSLIEYTPEGKPEPSLATEWTIAPDKKSVTLKLRSGVTFHSGTPFKADSVLATLQKGADPKRGKNVFATMSIVKDWSAPDDATVTINFKAPVPERQILDLLQFLLPIDPKGIDTVETVPAGTGPYTLVNRAVGQSLTLKANPKYWREKQPIVQDLVFTVFSEDASASAALESGAVDIVYNGSSRSAVRLKNAGFQVFAGPGPLVQVFRINSTRGPFRNKAFRQAFNHLMDRASILRVGYAGLGKVVALPWAPASPAYDESYNATYAYDLEKAKKLIAASGLSADEIKNWKLLVNGSDESSVAISQIVQGSLQKIGIPVELDMRQGAEYVTALLGGDFAATFGAVGNVQKFPSRVATNSIYRTSGNPVLKDPHPHPDYVAAIARVDAASGGAAEVKAAYDNLNKVMVDEAFGIPTNSYDVGLIVASDKIGGITLDIDNLFVARTIGFK
ncbi:ABC transporter substrate-binding protein [Bosea robiniae]|uniref:Peptide/nickel transport system substrate-binding protein/glutathione transport system substrate-binding protein n=1 Tax=Bosea robiniae TaxID=1036780 RepID=A0ABY0P500_9HYPH|nr:ABC transporter substrate-binding protein [Bosea robiniae]SDH36058.1 peptide/nickel transport system substrate-binding protein/glutathione transport system substrate-binding protein [Bosea robiniae]